MKKPEDLRVRTYSPKRDPVKPDPDLPGPNSAGQSGDDTGLSQDEVSSESVAELIEEGQYFEAEAVEGLERPDIDDRPVRVREVLEDDVPTEYPAKDSGLDTD